MKCGECRFSKELLRESDMVVCLIDANVYMRSVECNIPSIDNKLAVVNKKCTLSSFISAIDIARTAVKLMKAHNMTEEDALNTANIILGGNKIEIQKSISDKQ